MGHGHDDGAHVHGSAGDGSGHNAHAHDGHAPTPEPPPGPPPAHVLTIARITRVLGVALSAIAFAAALVLVVRNDGVGFCWSAFASLFGFCIWLAARDTLARGDGPVARPGAPAGVTGPGPAGGHA